MTDDHHWIDTPDKLNAFIAGLADTALLAVDTEFMRRNSFYPELALLQLNDGRQCALVDPLALDEAGLRPLGSVLANADHICVMHSAGEDMEALAPLLPQGPGRLFDTQIAAALTGFGAGISYQNLVREMTGVELDKGETRSNWLQRPLTASQRRYAALDVVYLPAMHAELQQRLNKLGRTAWLDEECRRLSQRSHATVDPQPQRRIAAASHWPAPRQAMLRRLLLWREDTARSDDTPRPWLFRDADALSLVDNPPRTLDDLRQHMRGHRAMRARQCRALLEELQRPMDDAELEQLQPVRAAPDREQRAVLKKMKKIVADVAAELDIPASLLCPRRLLEDLLLDSGWPGELEGWRQPLLKPQLSALLVR